ncbi:SDR family NAD(P)-dependent oxidoreductase [Mycobacterium lacus]|nr:SDR family NAD(P)-dependent oxidoreductase [Mycobacterium lacus]
MNRHVLVVIGVGGMGQAIARRLGCGKTVLLADNNEQVLTAVAESLAADGHRVESRGVDVASAESVGALAEYAASLGSVTQVAHTAGLFPAQASAEAILAVDLLGVALRRHLHHRHRRACRRPRGWAAKPGNAAS